jgi:hypothetical protein
MSRYLADVWLGSDSGFQTVEIDASSINGVTEQIKTKYHVKHENIRNVRLAENSPIAGDFSNTGSILIVLLILISFFPTYILMLLFGASGTWITLKLFGKSFWEISSPENTRPFIILSIVAILSGGTGFYIGTQIENPPQQIHRNQ